jgi:GT2 family glycosyltransferase
VKQSELIKPIENDQKPLVSIILLAFNYIDYTKLCVESLYRFTSHINFELITVNNGSGDDTEQFFNTLPHKKKINFTCHVGGNQACNEAIKLVEGKYTLFLNNDLILTPNWLDNLLKCMESDGKIGMVVPACNNTLNYQQVNLNYNNMDEMILATEAYNVSDPNKWEERVWLITYTYLTKTEIIRNFGGFEEVYTPGDFDADFCFRLRRGGYKLIFAKDTFLHHFGSIPSGGDCGDFILERNRRIFYSKFDVDPWDDCNIDFEMVSLIKCGQRRHVDVLILCASCGGTALQVKNKLCENGVTDVTLWTITEKQKYLQDLRSVSDYAVYGSFQDIREINKDKLYDYIIIEVDLQNIDNPSVLLQDVIKLLQSDGQLIFTVANETFYLNLFNLINGNVVSDARTISHCSFNIEKLHNFLANEGFASLQLYNSHASISQEHRQLIEKLKSISPLEDKEVLEELYTTKRMIFSAKETAKFKNVLLYPGDDSWLNDRIFNHKNKFTVLREELAKGKINLRTIDKGNIEQSDCIIFRDVPKSYNSLFFRPFYQYVYMSEVYFKECLASGKRSSMAFMIEESPFVTPENYDTSLHQDAAVIFTYIDELVDNRKYFKYIIPQSLPVENAYTVSYADKRLYTLMAGNKFSHVPGELYSERQKAIEYFEGNLSEYFDFYGPGWETSGYKCYKGQAADKLSTLSRYKYCICYENGPANGYITEKIFDCFFAGCVPVYLGAPNITDYIPANTFIDRRMFGSYEELHRYISAIDEDTYNTYLDNINRFLHGEAFQKFTCANFAQTITQVLIEHCNL